MSLTEIGLVGSIAIRTPGKKLEWQADRMEFTNSPEVNLLVRAPYRAGWEL